MRTILVAGMLAGDPAQGGATWAVLQYVVGLRRLGHDVIVVDPLPPGPIAPTVRRYFDGVCRSFGLVDRAALVPAGGTPYGMSAERLAAVCARSGILLNLSGRWRDHDALARIPVRAFIDLDPAFTQLWHAHGVELGLAAHTHHVTVGAGVAAGTAEVPPTPGVTWSATLPPVVLDEWPAVATAGTRGLTTVANWRSYGSIEHDGRQFGQKAHSFRALHGLPAATPLPIEVALAIHPGDDADRARLDAAGWNLVDATTATGDPARYRTFVQSSWAELGVAKTGYVAGRTGWVSDRTACYLASGRPAIVQDTALAGVLPIGEGLVTFDDVTTAAAAIEDVAARYASHRRAARTIAEEHLDARRVLASLLAQLAC